VLFQSIAKASVSGGSFGGGRADSWWGVSAAAGPRVLREYAFIADGERVTDGMLDCAVSQSRGDTGEGAS
jgi:hypothetical protein